MEALAHWDEGDASLPGNAWGNTQAWWESPGNGCFRQPLRSFRAWECRQKTKASFRTPGRNDGTWGQRRGETHKEPLPVNAALPPSHSPTACSLSQTNPSNISALLPTHPLNLSAQLPTSPFNLSTLSQTHPPTSWPPTYPPSTCRHISAPPYAHLCGPASDQRPYFHATSAYYLHIIPAPAYYPLIIRILPAY